MGKSSHHEVGRIAWSQCVRSAIDVTIIFTKAA
jgi:hypothetical protein